MQWKRYITIFLAGISWMVFCCPASSAEKAGSPPVKSSKASPAGPENKTAVVSIKKIYLKDDTVWVELEKQGNGDISEIGKLSLIIGQNEKSFSLKDKHFLNDLNQGKSLKFNTHVKMTQRATARAAITGNEENCKTVILSPMAFSGSTIPASDIPEQGTRKQGKKDNQGEYTEAMQNSPSASAEAALGSAGSVGTVVIVGAASDTGSDDRPDTIRCQGISVSYGINLVSAAETAGVSGRSYSIFWRPTPTSNECDEWTVFLYCGQAGGSLPEDEIHLRPGDANALHYDPASGLYTLPWAEPAGWPPDCTLVDVQVFPGYRPGPP